MKIKVYNLSGNETGEISLKEKVFGVKIKPEVVHEVFVAQMNNAREPWAHTKTKGDVRGGGKKPWKQKGTGRARHGSIRSPIWTGGGVTFGPLSVRNYKNKINKKTRQAATRMCLTDKAQGGAIFAVEDFNFSDLKTKSFAEFIKKLPISFKTFLVLTGDAENKNIYRITRNLKKIETSRAVDASVVSLLRYQAIIISKIGIEEIEKVLAKKD
jgi:large subunit ribosomal protein L4